METRTVKESPSTEYVVDVKPSQATNRFHRPPATTDRSDQVREKFDDE